MHIKKSIIAITGWALLLTQPANAQGAPATPTAERPEVRFAGALRSIPTNRGVDHQKISEFIARLSKTPSRDRLDAIKTFVQDASGSPWGPSLYANLGAKYLHEGRFSQALEAWGRAWTAGKDVSDPEIRRIVDKAGSDRARLLSLLGRYDEVGEAISTLQGRNVSGAATEPLQDAATLYGLSRKDPRHLYVCGAAALRSMMVAEGYRDRLPHVESIRATPQGMSLQDVSNLASGLGQKHVLIRRSAGSAIPSLAVVHWKLGHYGAIVGERDGYYHVIDTIFPGDGIWMSREAIDEESDGFFLVSDKVDRDPSWEEIGAGRAGKVWGRGPTSSTMPGGAGDTPANVSKEAGCPLCGYNIEESSVALTLSDTPVGYAPSIGPAVRTVISYDQRDGGQPSYINYTSVGQKWTVNWVAYIVDDPERPGNTVSRYAGGSTYYYSGYSASTGRFSPQFDSGAILVRSSDVAASYRRQMPDGSIEIYAQSDGASEYPRKMFLSEVRDPHGNAIHVNYDGLRVRSITDALGRDTIFSYDPNGLLTAVTDPFGRSARLTYESGRLKTITDIIGLTSSFSYDQNALVNALITPYGASTFSYTAPGTTSSPRFVEATDARGYKEREEWIEPAPVPGSEPSGTVPTGMPLPASNTYLEFRDSFHWDKDAYATAGCTSSGGCNYTLARNTHYLHYNSSKSTIPESVKMPLENRTWFQYANQTSPVNVPDDLDTYISPVAAARVLEDGTTQLTRASYDNPYYKITSSTDAVGRTTTFAYSSEIDLAAVSQTTENGQQVPIAQYAYDTRHLPVVSVDAAGQITSYGYNAKGQLARRTDALGHTTTYAYDSLGRLTSSTNANSAVAATYTYDAYDRIATATDSEGLVVLFSYDAADRIVRKTYQDGTTDLYAYDRLDLASYTNRLGQTWRYEHDATRNLTAVVNPANERTQFSYSGQGRLLTLTDAKGQVTSWAYDIQGRPTTKTYEDGKTISYAYDATGRIKSQTDALGQVKQFAYTKDNQVASISYVNPVNPTPGVSFTYDRYYSRVASMTDGTGTTQYQYGAVGAIGALQVTLETGPNPAISYVFDALGRTTSRTVGNAAPEIFAYDAIGRISSHGSSLGTFNYAYLGQTGQLTSRTLAGSSLATTWTYQPNIQDRRLASISNVGLNAGQHTDFAYDIDSAGMVTGITQSSDAVITYPSPTTQTAGYNSLNQLSMLDAQSFTYDANGNLISDGPRTYSWDADNRLIGITYSNSPGQATTFTYDGLGRQISMTSTPTGGGVPTIQRYAWCGSNPCGTVGPTGDILKQYLQEGEKTDTNTVYYGIDQIGSVRRAFTTSSAPAYDYDPYGQLIGGGAPITDYVYAGLRRGPANDLYLSNTRPYSPRTGRWLQRDMLGESADPSGNLYAYTGGNVSGLADPNGTNPVLAGAAIGAIVYGGFDLYTQYQNGTLNACKFNYSEFLGQIGTGALNGALLGMTPFGVAPVAYSGSRLLATESLVSETHIAELITNGIKFTPDAVVATGRNSAGQVIFLETGNAKAGLQHIVEQHGADFARAGISEANIPGAVMKAVTEGSLVGYQGSGKGRAIYEILSGQQTQRVAVTVGSNGFIVGANPAGRIP